MKVSTELSPTQYARFKEKAAKLGLSEYALAKEGVLLVTFEPQDLSKLKKVAELIMDFFESGQNIP